MATNPDRRDVIALTGSTLSEDIVNAIIDDAALVVSGCIVNLDAARQTAIIKWVAAHMVASTSSGGGGVLSSQKLGDASESYARGELGKALNSSYYGQQAIALDPNGCLRKIGQPSVGFQVI